MLALWLSSVAVFFVAIGAHQIEYRYIRSLRKQARQPSSLFLAFWELISHSKALKGKTRLEDLAKKLEYPFVKTGGDVVALIVVTSLGLGVFAALATSLILNNYTWSLELGGDGALFSLIALPFLFRSEAKKNIEKLDREVMLALPMFRTFFSTGAKGKDVLEAMVRVMPAKSPLNRRLQQMVDLMYGRGYAFLESMRVVANEWDSKSLTFLVDLIDKAESNKTPVGDEIQRQLDLTKEKERQDAEAEAEKKKETVLMVVTVVLYAPGMLYLLSVMMNFSNFGSFS